MMTYIACLQCVNHDQRPSHQQILHEHDPIVTGIYMQGMPDFRSSAESNLMPNVGKYKHLHRAKDTNQS